MHLLGRMTLGDNACHGSHELEGELREVVRMRGNIVSDAFDVAISEDPVFIVPGTQTFEEFFSEIGKHVSGRLGFAPEKITNKLIEREVQSSTVISPGVAVPHATISDRGDFFEIILVKSEGGVDFGSGYAPVNTVILMFSSPGKRSEYLRGLAMVAQTILSGKFESR